MSSLTSIFKIFKLKAFLQLFKKVITNTGATFILFIGIAFIAAGFGIAFQLMPTALVPIIISSLGGFIGTFIIAGVLHRFAIRPSDDDGKLKEVLAETREVQQKNLELTRSLEKTEAALEKAKEASEKAKEALEKVQAEKTELQNQLNSSVNITKILPVMKIIPAEISFDYTDYCEKPLGEEHYTRIFSRKEHKDPVFYRGVIKSTGKMNIALDLQKTKLIETADTITICGPFEYETSIINRKDEWLMHGRREEESHHGKSETDLEMSGIKIVKALDTNGEDEQKALLDKKIYNLPIVESAKLFVDQLAFEYVRMMLAPTGKKITYNPTANGAFSTMTLGELVTSYNNKITMLSQTAHSLNS